MSNKMTTVFDYLDWRGDMPFSRVPFNEVDNVILSMIAYVDFEDVFSEEKQLPLSEVSARYFSSHTREELLKRDTFVRMTPFLMEKAATTLRFSGIVLHDHVNIIDSSADEQFSAVAYDLDDGTTYIGFRGTDDTIVGWKEDLNLAYVEQTMGQQHAKAYLSETGSRLNGSLRIGGHSKGGNLAMYASAFCEESVRKRIMEIYNNDGPGFRKEVAYSDEIKEIKPIIKCIIPNESVFGILMYGDFEHTVIMSNNLGIMQHDALSWQVLGSRFIRADGLSASSQIVDKALMNWVEGVKPEEREQFVQFVYDAVRTSGASTLEELNLRKIRNYSTIMQAAFKMDKSRRESFLKVVSALIKSSTNTLAGEIKKAIDEHAISGDTGV